jgi:hypothetical protein
MRTVVVSVFIATLVTFACSEFADWAVYLSGSTAPEGVYRAVVQAVAVSFLGALAYVSQRVEGRS